jgi:hypothetical protein
LIPRFRFTQLRHSDKKGHEQLLLLVACIGSLLTIRRSVQRWRHSRRFAEYELPGKRKEQSSDNAFLADA